LVGFRDLLLVLLLKEATGVISYGDAFAMLAQIQE
jgi:hypothetical protein